MPTLSGYKTTEQLYSGPNSLVYRGYKESDRRPVILKILNHSYPSTENIARFKLEYQLLQSLNDPTQPENMLDGVITAYHFAYEQQRWIMELEDFGGHSLNKQLQYKPLELIEFLKLAIRLVQILEQIHQRHVVHKDINPSNIVLNPATNQVKLIDFGIATTLIQETPTLYSPHWLEGTLAYMSPEQTGRMNRVLDYRSDFYSLGVTFYELLTGQVPFPTTDMMELVHCHLAKQPPAPHEVNPDIPPLLSEIVQILTAKNAEDRYQSTLPLKTDLEECLHRWQTTGQAASFPLRQQDISGRFQIPQKLYGRELEITQLLAAFERVSSGASELILVSGHTGIGKSAVIREIYKPVTRQRGYFISGKFEEFRRDIPYAPFISAFRSLVSQLFTETEAIIAGWRKTLLDALGVNGQIIIEVIPEIERIIGTQPDVPEVPPSEAHNRFNLVLQNFIRAFAQAQHPLVIFLDDLQWADRASLKLIEVLMSANSCPYLLLIGAYRNNEVDDQHPVNSMIRNIQQAQVPITYLFLPPLNLSHTTELIADAYHCTVEQARPLAKLILQKTEGTPFFINEFLEFLYAESLTTFDFASGRWQWDLLQIQARGITDNIAELLVGKIQKLALPTQHILGLASCIGNQVDLYTLAMIADQSAQKTALDLWEAVSENLLIPLSDTYKLVNLDMEGFTDEMVITYKFAHDQIQQAIYSLIPEEERAHIHYQIGQFLLQETPITEQGEKVFDIVSHLNQSEKQINTQSEREQLAQLNLMAGQKAKISTAYESAFEYLEKGLDILVRLEEDAGVNSWEREYDLFLVLHLEAAEAAYLSGRYDRMEVCGDAVLQYALNLLDRVKIYEIKIQAYIAQNRWPEVVQTGLFVLEQLGIKFPKKPQTWHILLEMGKTRVALFGKSTEDLSNLPEMEDLHALAAIRIFRVISGAAFISSPNLFPLIVFKQVQLSIKYGNTSASALSYIAYAVILCGVLGNVNAGYQFGQLALTILEKFNARALDAQILFMANFFIKPWKHHIRDTLVPLLEAYERGLETGDLEFAANTIVVFIGGLYYTGTNLAELEQEMEPYQKILVNLRQERAIHSYNLYGQVIFNLRTQVDCPYDLMGPIYNEEVILPICIEKNDSNAICSLYVMKLMLGYLFHHDEPFVEWILKIEECLNAFTGLYSMAIAHFYLALARLAILPEAPKAILKQIYKKVDVSKKKLKQWAAQAPMNFLHKYYLVEAEYARVLGKDEKARDLYDRAIILAQENQYVNDEALAYELAGRFYLAKKQNHIANHYFADARYAYQRWGATAKVTDLENRYPQFLSQIQTTSSVRTSTSTTTIEQSTSLALDLTSVLKASQAISEEIKLETVLAKMMTIVIENAGAEKGYLLLKKQGGWTIDAAGVVDQAEVATLQSIPISTDDVSLSIVNYVAHTHQNVVLDDAVNVGEFIQDEYIIANQPKSILCAPLLNQGKLSGIVYLENNLTTGAFTPDRLEVLNLLSSQAAVSLENATLYNTLEERVEERTEQLAHANQEITALNEMLTEENLRMSAELEVTQRLQRMLLPTREELQQIDGLDIAAYMEPAEEVGGDYYDVLQHNGLVKIGMGDVTGHGLESGVVMLMTQMGIRTLLNSDETDPVRFQDILNRTIYDNIQRMGDDKNLTLILLDYEAGQVRLSGQHEDVIIVRRNGEIELLDTLDLGFPIGLDYDIAEFIHQTSIRLEPGDGIVLYTDGVTEAEDLENIQYGLDRLCDVVSRHWMLSAEAIKEAVIADVRLHIGEQEVYDDITLLVLKQI